MAEEQSELKIYNSMTNEKEIFKPKLPGNVSMYVCGVTAYDYSHLGHARATVSFDILYRYLKHLGYEVTYVRNFIDVDDKIINNGYAYEVDGDVFYAVDKFPNYGMLSGQRLEHNRAGERVVVDSRKRHPADFVLWKAAKPGEPSWDSPWGPGRPGWHIECSAMSACYLSHKFIFMVVELI